MFSRAGEYPDDGYTAGDNILCFQGYPETRRRAMFNFRLAFDDPSRDEPAKAFADIDEGESDGDIRGEWDMRLLPAHVYKSRTRRLL